MLGLLINPKDGGDIFLRNVGGLKTDYTALYPQKTELLNLLIHKSSDISRISSNKSNKTKCDYRMVKISYSSAITD
jgi:hypothetical protein